MLKAFLEEYMYYGRDAENIKLEVLTQTQQELHFSAQVSPGYCNFIITISTNFNNRMILWHNLRSVAELVSSHNLPWIVMGDFS